MSPTTRSSAQEAEKLPSSAAQSATLEVSMASQAPQTVRGPKLSPLSYLTTQSARFGVWEVAIFNPTARTREYIWNQEKRTSYSFQCMLVSTADPTQYVLGDSHGKGMNAVKLNELKNKFMPGLVFHMTHVVFADNMKKQYNSAPKTEVVSMTQTTWSPVSAKAQKFKMAEPNIPVAESMGIEHEQQFDALALVHDIFELHNGGTHAGQQRLRFKILLTDGSKNKDTGKMCHLPVTIFVDGDLHGQPPSLYQQLQAAHAQNSAMAFFGIQGKKSDSNDGTWSFTSNFAFFCKQASETRKGRDLEAKAVEIRQAEGEAVPLPVYQNRNFEQNESFADMEATETTCALLQSIMIDTKVKAIETDTTFWQINWCYVHPPGKAAQVCTNDNSRLWMPVKVEDDTGHINIYMREKAALDLSHTDSKEEFEAARADDSMDFPKKVSVKIIRKPSAPQTPDARDSAARCSNIQCYIVEAAEQLIHDTPSKSSLTLLNFLEHTDAHTDACAAAGISMIEKDPHYGLSISYIVDNEVVRKRCTRAVALVVANNASKSDNMNEGYQMITEGVSDPLDKNFVCTLMSFCTLRTSPDYQLKPARGMKTQTAFVVIADVLEVGSAEKPPVFLVESLEKIPDSEAETAPDHIRRLIHFASLTAKMQGKSSKREWTEDMSPANARKCRRLGKSPTDDLLEKYDKP